MENRRRKVDLIRIGLGLMIVGPAAGFSHAEDFAAPIVMTSTNNVIKTQANTQRILVTGGQTDDAMNGAFLYLNGNGYSGSQAGTLHIGTVNSGSFFIYTNNAIRYTISGGGVHAMTGPVAMSSTLDLATNLNINAAANVSGHRVNVNNGWLTANNGFGFKSFASGNPGDANSEVATFRHNGAEDARIEVSRNGTGAFRGFRIYTSDAERYRVTAGGEHTFTGSATFSNNLNVSGTITGGSGRFTGTLASGGRMAIGDVPPPNTNSALDVRTPSLSGSSQYGVVAQTIFNTQATVSGAAIQASLVTAANVAMTNGFGLRVSSPGKGQGSTIANLFGIKVEDQVGGYALHTSAGLVHFGGEVTAGSGVTVSGTLTATNGVRIGNDYSALQTTGTPLLYGSNGGFGSTGDLAVSAATNSDRDILFVSRVNAQAVPAGRVQGGSGALEWSYPVNLLSRLDVAEDATVGGSLTVGSIRANSWEIGEAPDYVFEKEYPLASLEKVESFVRKNKHLPEVPSAKKMKEEGLDLVKMNFLLLKKVEELTLHAIRQEKEMKRQAEEIRELKARRHH